MKFSAWMIILLPLTTLGLIWFDVPLLTAQIQKIIMTVCLLIYIIVRR